MVKKFEIRSGRHAVARIEATSAPEALTDYLRGLGCREGEVRRLGAASASWRGAIYRVALLSDEDTRAA
jgi:hypothetical protein